MARGINSAGARTFHVRDFGAVGNGKTLDTEAIQKAVDAAHENSGGTVLVPAGDFLIGPIELKSNVTLYLAAEARLVGTAEKGLYHPARGIPLNGDHTMGDGNTGLVYAANADIAVEWTEVGEIAFENGAAKTVVRVRG